MKIRKFLAMAIALTMALSAVPAIAVNAAELDDASLLAYAKTTQALFDAINPAPTAANDTDIDTAWPDSGWSGTVNNGYINVAGGTSTPRIQSYIGYYTNGNQKANTVNLPGYGVGNEWVLVSFIAEYTGAWGDVALYDTEGNILTAVRYGKGDSNAFNVSWGHSGWGTPYSFSDYTLSSDSSVTIESGSSQIDILLRNYADYYTATFFVDGTSVCVGTYTGRTFKGLGSIGMSRGSGSDYERISMQQPAIYAGDIPGNIVAVEASYTVNGEVVGTVTKSYDSEKTDGAEFDAYAYSANGENVLYTAKAISLSQSEKIEMTPVSNSGEYKAGDVAAYGGKQYSVKSDNLIPNGDFSYGLAGWYTCADKQATDANFTAEGNTVKILNGGGSESEAALYRAWDVEIGKTYFLTFTLDEATQWARVTEGSSALIASATNTLRDEGSSVKGKNNLVFTATDEFIRVSFPWAEGRTVSGFGLYEVEEAQTILDEEIKSVSLLSPIKAIDGDRITLPLEVTVEGTLGSIVKGSVSWNEPDTYPLGETVTVTGTVSAAFYEDAESLTTPVTVDVTVFPYDHEVETFWHAGDDSNSANFGLYNYLGYYGGGVIVADTAFSVNDGTNKLIMYGNSSSGSFDGCGALLRMFNTQSGGKYVFEYHNGGWKQSDVVCEYGVSYVLRTEIDITNRKYSMYISASGGSFEAICENAVFRNGGLSGIDRMISTGSMTISSHKTAWIEGFSYLNVKYVDENGVPLKDGYRVKAATGVIYTDNSAPKLIESGGKLYILENVDSLPSQVVAEGEDTLSVAYRETEMTEFESPYVNHVRGDSAINLPSRVKMVFSDGQKILFDVAWDTTKVDVTALGEYTVMGTIDGIDMKATATVKVRDVEILDKTTENTVVTNNGGWNWYVEPSGTHIQPGDELASRYESGIYTSNNGYKFKHDKTYMGWVEDEGTIVVGEYDHDNDTYKRVVIHEFLEADDHNNPAVVVLPDGRIMVFYSKHTTEERMYYCVSKNPEDISEWNDWQYYYCYTEVENSTYNATYPTVFMVHDDCGIEGNDVIYVGWRGVHWKPTLAKFSMPDENGVIKTIMGQTQFANTSYYSYDDGGRNDGGRRPYTKYDYDFERNKIYITFTANHPDNDVKNHIYYVTLDITDQGIYTAKGSYLQPLPFENRTEYVSQGAMGTTGQWGVLINELIDDYPELLVFDASEQTGEGYGSGGSNERRGWTWDIKVNEAGEPCIVYVDITATAPGEGGSLPTWYGPNVNDSHRSHHYYWYARWDTDTQTWVKTFLTYGGKWWHENATQERCYSGGLTFDHNAPDANVIYLSIPTMGEYGNIFEIYRWESDDHGATWTIREPITENSKINNVRPNAIYNYKVDEDGNHAGPRLLWKSGEYRYWMNYEYKTGVWTDFSADGFITQDDPEMFADAALYVNGEKTDTLPVGEDITLTGRFNITNISIGDGSVLTALAHYNAEGALVEVKTDSRTVPARSVPQIGMIGAPKTADGSLSAMGDEEVIVEIDYTASFSEGDTLKLFAWNTGIEHPMSSIISVPFETGTAENKYAFAETFTYEGTEKLILDENGENFNGWIGKAYGDGAAFGTHSYAAVTKAPFGNTGLHLYHVGSGGETGSGAVMASHALPDSQGRDYQIKFSMRYIDEMSWNNTANAGFTLSHGVPVYNDGNATPCAIQFRHGSTWRHYNGRGTTGYLRRTRWFDGGGLSWIFDSGIRSEYGRGNEYDALMTGSNYEVTIDVSPKSKTISFSIFDGHRTVYQTESYVDADTYDWDNNPIDTITFSVGDDKWGEIYIDDVTVEITE